MPERVRFLALQEEYREVEAEVARRFSRVLTSQSFVLGEQTVELETAMARLVGVRHAVAVSSGSDALFLALRALDVGSGAAVLVPSYTFIASAGAVVHAGAVPVFTDVDPRTLNIGAQEIEAALREQFDERRGEYFHRATGTRLAAVLVVHLFGRAAAMRDLGPLAARLRIHVVEDAAQAIGAAVDGLAVGAWGRLGCFSFYPTKNLGGAGDGGVLTTDDADLATRLARLRVHGAEASALQAELGVNARMGELQAAYLNAKWPHLDAWTRRRDRFADEYAERLAALPREALEPLPHASGREHVHHQVAVRILGGRRDRVVRALAEAGIESRVFYPAGLHRQPCFRRYGTERVQLPVTDAAADEILCLPIHAVLGTDGVGAVCDALSRAIV